MEWMKKQFRRPSHCTFERNNTRNSDLDDAKKKDDGSAKLPCCGPESPTEPQNILKVDEEDYYCVIKLQNPYESSYESEEKIIFPPCPPKTYQENPREPTCDCELCKKNKSHRRCCEPRQTSIYNPNKKVGKLEHA